MVYPELTIIVVGALWHEQRAQLYRFSNDTCALPPEDLAFILWLNLRPLIGYMNG
ncbi:MAG: hypothetical protein K9G11_03110 [Rickettsiaceae bacterium]|nr:hypothetical protein [Rickettsiaceae bacterium]